MLNKLRNAVLLVVGGLVLFWAASTLVGVVQGGEPHPPGPPGPTMKPLDQVEARTPIVQPDPGGFPIVIDQPGSYYLVVNITGEQGDNGIEISADNVTLDLNGFTLIGPGKAMGSDDGVHVECEELAMPIPCENISIYNGTVRDWGGSGVDGASSDKSRYENLLLYNNGVDGLDAGSYATVIGCISRNNERYGINSGGGVITDCVVSYNGDHGIWTTTSIVSNCRAEGNGGHGMDVGAVSRVSNCISYTNSGDGIRASMKSVVMSNVAEGNTAGGIHVIGADNRIEGNNVTNNNTGIDVDVAGNLIIKNSASGNTTQYAIFPGNTVGPIYGVADPIAGTNPWANFSY